MLNVRLLYKSLALSLNELVSLIISGEMINSIRSESFLLISCILYDVIWNTDLYDRKFGNRI